MAEAPDAPPAAPADEPSDTSVRIYLPDERLRSFATFYYFVECKGPLEDFLYPEWGNVRFLLRGTWWVESAQTRAIMPQIGALFGPTDRAAKVISENGMCAGFGLTPLGWQRFFDKPADRMANRIVDLDRACFGVAGEELRAVLSGHMTDQEGVALFDRLLLDRLEVRRPNSEVAINVDRVLRDRPHDVSAFAAAAGLAPRTLGRICKQVFGFGAKRLLRRQRFLDTLGQIRITEHPNFSTLMDAEYFDLAHFNHEFHEFMGLSPSQYIAVPRPLMGQAALVQLQAGIPLSFKLPPPPEE
jgi:AraC-like DNA-binding protein